MITGSTSNLTVAAQLKNQKMNAAYQNAHIQNAKHPVPTLVQGSSIPQIQHNQQSIGALKAKSRKGRRTGGYPAINAANTFYGGGLGHQKPFQMTAD